MKDNHESEQNRYSLFTVQDAENGMTAFTIFAIAITVSIFFHGLLIKQNLPIMLNTIVSSLSAVVGNVSSILSGATLLTILLEGADIMFFRRTREERAKLKDLEESFRKDLELLAGLQHSNEKVEKWNKQRLNAASRNEPFTEPMPDLLTVDMPKRRRFGTLIHILKALLKK